MIHWSVLVLRFLNDIFLRCKNLLQPRQGLCKLRMAIEICLTMRFIINLTTSSDLSIHNLPVRAPDQLVELIDLGIVLFH
ncbi:hypothetical protein D3C85_1691110 [compost metagenome]